MRVIYFSNAYSPHDHLFLSALAQTGHRVFYLRLEGEDQASERRSIPPNIEQIHWTAGRTRFQWRDVPRVALDLRRVTREIRPELIHAGPIQSCAFIALLSGFRPVLTMSWGFDLMQDADRDAWWRWVTSYTLRRTTFFVSDAYVTRDRAVAFGMDPRRTLVFPWGVDLELFSPAASALDAKRHRLHSGGPETAAHAPVIGTRKPFTLFCNRSWEPRYGVDVLAHAFVKALRKDPKLRLILLGSGSQTQLIRRILEDGGATQNVLFAGHVAHPELPLWYRMADVFISASHVDGSSVSLMEALACGVPALVSDLPANQEWVQDGKNGWLFRDGDVDDLARQILWLASQRRNLGKLRRSARESAEEKADWNRNFQVLLQAYDRTVRSN